MRKVWLAFKEGAERLWSLVGKPLLAFATFIPIILLFFYVYDTFKEVAALKAEVQKLTDATKTADARIDALKSDLAAIDSEKLV